MAWSTCPYCQARLNGWQIMERHQQKAHPAEYQVVYTQKMVGWTEERLAGHIKDKEEYEILDTFLAQDGLPTLIVHILTPERDKRSVVFYQSGKRVVIPFDQQIAEDTAWLEQKRAELAALQPAEVIA